MSELELNEGVWMVRKIQDGKQYTYLADKVEDLPEKMTKIQMEKYRYEIANNMKNYLFAAVRDGIIYADDIKIDNLMKCVFRALD